MGPSSERGISPRPTPAGRIRTLLVAATLAIGPIALGWTPPGMPATARADCCGMLGPIRQLTALGDVLVFTAYDRRHGWELWRSDGTAEGTRMIKDIRPGKQGSGMKSADCEGCSDAEASPPVFAGLAGRSVILWADDGLHGLEPWRSDGTAKGTRLLQDVRPGRAGSLARDGDPTGAAVGDLLYFGADDARHPPSLWRTDGTGVGTIVVTDSAGSDGPVGAWSLTAVDDGFYFFARSDGWSSDVWRGDLWHSDGTAEGTTLVMTAEDDMAFQDLVAADGMLYFADQGTDAPDSTRLWRTDGTAEGTFPIKQPISLGVPFVTTMGDAAYFGHQAVIRSADPDADDTSWPELWRTDGTPEGTTLVKAFEESPHFPRFTGAAVLGGTLYLTMEREPSRELWRSDGTAEGTTLVKAFDESFGEPRPVVVGATLYVVIDDELWRSDGTAEGTTLVVDMAPGDKAFVQEGPVVVEDALYFTVGRAVGRAGRGELWRSDGTPEGTVRLLALSNA